MKTANVLSLPALATLPVLAAALADVGHASGVIFAAGGVEVTFGHPPGTLEFAHPIAAGAKAGPRPMIEWRDAGFDGPGMYQDWIGSTGLEVGDPGTMVLLGPGQSGSTATSLDSDRVGVHLVTGPLSGIGRVFVDGVLVASLDLFDVAPTGVLVSVSGLAPGAHAIEVRSGGDSPTGPLGVQNDVRILGASTQATLLATNLGSLLPVPTEVETGLTASCAAATCPTPLIGTSYWDPDATPGVDLGFTAANIGPTLVDLGIGCLPFGLAELCLNPSDPIFTPSLTALGVTSFGTDADGDPVWSSSAVPFPGCTAGLSLSFQAFRYDPALARVASSSELREVSIVPCP